PLCEMLVDKFDKIQIHDGAQRGGISARLGFANGPSIPTRETPTGSGPAGACIQSPWLSLRAGRRTGRTATASMLAAHRERNQPSSCPSASPSTYGNRTRNLEASPSVH